jgi:hypothetical protein
MSVSSEVNGAGKSVWRAVVDTHPEAIAAALQGLADRVSSAHLGIVPELCSAA